MRRIGPGVAAFVALIGDQTIANHDQQAPFRGLLEQAAGHVAQRGTEACVAAGGQPEVAGHGGLAILEILEAGDVDAMPRFRSEEHTSELQSLMRIPYAVFCLKKTNKSN